MSSSRSAPLDSAALAALLHQHAPLRAVPLCPALEAWHAEDELPLWSALEDAQGAPVPPPFFAVCWPGAQALARVLLEPSMSLVGTRVIDIGCGSGIAGIAAAQRGARVTAVDIDPLAVASAQLLARHHGVTMDARVMNPLMQPDALVEEFDLVLAGDLVSSAVHADAARQALNAWQTAGMAILLADSGRPFFDACGLSRILTAQVPVPRSLEGTDLRTVHVYAHKIDPAVGMPGATVPPS